MTTNLFSDIVPGKTLIFMTADVNAVHFETVISVLPSNRTNDAIVYARGNFIVCYTLTLDSKILTRIFDDLSSWNSL